MATAAIHESTARKLTKRGLSIVAIVFLVLFALIETMPFVLTIANSFKCLPAVEQFPQVFVPNSLTPTGCKNENGITLPATATTTPYTFTPSLEGYEKIFQFDFPMWFVNSIIYAVNVTILRLILNSMAGYALARMTFVGKRAYFFGILGIMMVPGIVLVIPKFIIMRELGLLNTYWGLILALAADPFGVILMKQFFESVPKELEEAAFVDGASHYTIFFRIILPISTPALTALAIFSFQGTWNNFMDVLIINGSSPNLYNLPLGLALLRGQFGDTLEWNTFLAGAVMTTLPMAIIFFIFQRYFVEGISYTGIKG